MGKVLKTKSILGKIAILMAVTLPKKKMCYVVQVFSRVFRWATFG